MSGWHTVIQPVDLLQQGLDFLERVSRLEILRLLGHLDDTGGWTSTLAVHEHSTCIFYITRD